MKETIYRCDRCGHLITDTRHKITAQDENGNATKYGALLENIDLCEDCMASTSLAILDLIGDTDKTKDGPEDPRRQQDDQPDTENQPETYKCSEVIKTCKYADKVGAAMCCNYINIAGHRRGCEPEQCDKYEKIVRKRGPKPKGGSRCRIRNVRASNARAGRSAVMENAKNTSRGRRKGSRSRIRYTRSKSGNTRMTCT